MKITRHPVGSGPFPLRQRRDRQGRGYLERNDDYWGERAKLARVRFAVVPDATTQALELRKGSGDVAINSLTPDTVVTLGQDRNLLVEHAARHAPGLYGIQLARSNPKDVRVRQAIAYAARPAADDRLSMARPGTTSAQRAAAAELGVRRRRAGL